MAEHLTSDFTGTALDGGMKLLRIRTAPSNQVPVYWVNTTTCHCRQRKWIQFVVLHEENLQLVIHRVTVT